MDFALQVRKLATLYKIIEQNTENKIPWLFFPSFNSNLCEFILRMPFLLCSGRCSELPINFVTCTHKIGGKFPNIIRKCTLTLNWLTSKHFTVTFKNDDNFETRDPSQMASLFYRSPCWKTYTCMPRLALLQPAWTFATKGSAGWHLSLYFSLKCVQHSCVADIL